MMRAAAFISYPAGLTALAVVSILRGEHSLGLCLVGLSALWIPVVSFECLRRLRTPMLIGAVALCGIAVFLDQPVILGALALSAAIYGWDVCLTLDDLSTYPEGSKGRFATRYLVLSAILAAAGAGLAGASSLWQATLSFSSALGLAVGMLLISLVLLRLARGTIDASSTEDD